ncbi:MAG TPA: hypothetical protein VMC84_13740 [Methanocella sp.]|uniref:hypothetical protein n=1 Tax=Methanocella sp. TaxID=2052833 RepID=UPI002BD3493D|nr:hypothetical protein [Methanocella sp.]HTY92233.1 hypothetical protein [Methanocella sp.]
MSGALHFVCTLDKVDAILNEAKEKHLVPRPYRNEKGRLDWICFCCDDCCGYFRGLHDPCEKGSVIESTDTAAASTAASAWMLVP